MRKLTVEHMPDLWVFGYASLMWRPDFQYAHRTRATLFGYHRALCITSYEHRGTRQRPGLVMGLDRGGSCVGIAYQVTQDDRHAAIAYLRERELITHVYKEVVGHIRLDDGSKHLALTYVADQDHEQYAGKVDVQTAVERVHGAVGRAGPNEDYVLNTSAHIRELGIRDHWMEDLESRLRQAMAS
ncbi:MAG: gamma-glutamylcyclotransferase [Pseudomonadota bacterium]